MFGNGARQQNINDGVKQIKFMRILSHTITNNFNEVKINDNNEVCHDYLNCYLLKKSVSGCPLKIL